MSDEGTRVLVLPWDKSTERARLQRLDPEASQLDQMQALVGGLIEAVAIDDSAVLWCNEEYSYDPAGFYEDETGRHPKVNTMATALCKGHTVMALGAILGDCFVTGYDDDEGNTIDVPVALVAKVHTVLHRTGRPGVVGFDGAPVGA